MKSLWMISVILFVMIATCMVNPCLAEKPAHALASIQDYSGVEGSASISNSEGKFLLRDDVNRTLLMFLNEKEPYLYWVFSDRINRLNNRSDLSNYIDIFFNSSQQNIRYYDLKEDVKKEVYYYKNPNSSEWMDQLSPVSKDEYQTFKKKYFCGKR